jgi:hypothetical protein
MADPMLNFCVVEFDVRRLLENGHRDEAEELIIAKFRAGYSSPPLLQLVADLLALKPLKRRAWPRSGAGPYQWLEIGTRDQELRWEHAEYRAKRQSGKRRRRDEKKPEPRLDTLMREFKRGKNTIKTALAYYRIARSEYDRGIREFEREEREAREADREAK